MKIQFDSNQEYQIEAINAVVDLFDGQPLNKGDFEILWQGQEHSLFQNELGVGNNLVLDDDTLWDNVLEIQQRNGIESPEDLQGRHFSVEMETGTGKTYIYLRTIYELNIKYGFKKFIIVVPSVAIREGVLKNLEITAEHFSNLYNNTPINYWVYDSKKVSSLRQFAGSNQLQILVINIDAFNKVTNNVIHNEQDKLSGLKPIDFIQASNPIVIIDEPQNMESETAQKAIESLNPLCTLRYSATHRNLFNLLYRLDPVRAYDLRLVKRIEVDSVLSEDNFNETFLRLNAVTPTKARITANLTIHIDSKAGPTFKNITVKHGDNLFIKSNERAAYKEGYVVSEIDAASGCIIFTNGVTLYKGETQGGMNDDIMKAQIYQTVKEHLEKERKVKDKGIKVLSLFFIDRVANYRFYENGQRNKGKIAIWFEEAYRELMQKPQYKGLISYDVDLIHDGYFSQDKKGLEKDTSGNSLADDDTYNLIMKDKERLLSLDEPLRFIFSHSALREGWDNPNVFQICTLNETKSELKKRQEIGRGLRLPVDKDGYRVFDDNINRLTVIANESYEDFARALQSEIEEECGVNFAGRIKNKRERRKANLKKGYALNEDFKELWERIKHKTRYSVEYDTDQLINDASEAIGKMQEITAPKIVHEKVGIDIKQEGVTKSLLRVGETSPIYGSIGIPDILGYLQRETELTRGTLAHILIKSGRLGDVYINPQQFMDRALKEIRRELHKLMINGIKYEKIAGEEYEMLLFEQREIESYISNMIEVNSSIYDAIVVDSDIERNFAQALDSREDIRLFIKLPGWFKVETPIGSYNPDWAIVKETDEKLYLVRETKYTIDEDKLRVSESDKIRCGKQHFDTLNVDFKEVTNAKQV